MFWQAPTKRLGEPCDEKGCDYQSVTGPAHRRLEQRQTAPDHSCDSAERQVLPVGLVGAPKADAQRDEEQNERDDAWRIRHGPWWILLILRGNARESEIPTFVARPDRIRYFRYPPS